MEEELREKAGREEKHGIQNGWTDWIKMAGVKEHLSIYTVIAWLYIHVKQPSSLCRD